MVQQEVLIFKIEAINALSTSAISSCEVSALGHEARDDSVEVGSCVCHLLSKFSDTEVALSNGSEVLDSPRYDVAKESEDNAPDWFLIDLDIKEDLVSHAVEGVRLNSCCIKGSHHTNCFHLSERGRVFVTKL